MSAVIGSLRANLGLDTARFDAGLSKSKTSMASWGRGIKQIAIVGLAAITAAAAGMAVAIRSSIDEADRIGKLSQSLGVSVGELSTLKFAAGLAGVEFETLATSVRKLAGSMSDALRTPTSEQALAFKALGISVTDVDGKMKSSTQVMNEVADRFAKMKDGVNKTKTAVVIFGRAGAGMIPMLNEGSAGIKKMTEEAEALGLKLSKDTTNRAQEFNDTLARIRAVFDGLVTKITAAVLPTLQNIAKVFFDISKKGGQLEAVSKGVAWIMNSVAAAGLQVGAAFQEISIWATTIQKAWAKLKEFDLSGAYDTMKDGANQVAEVTKQLAAKVKQIWTETSAQVSTSPIVPDLRTDGNSLAAAQAALVAQKKATDDAAKSFEKLKRQGQQVFEATRTPLEQLKAETARLNDLLNAGVINWNTYGRAVEMAQDQFDESRDGMSEFGEFLEGQATGAFDRFIDGTFRLRDSLKALAKDLLKMLANSAIKSMFSALSGGGGGGGFGAALSSAFGGFLASGGPAMAGKAHIVGEKGPELFVPGMSGTVVPNNQLKSVGGGGSVMISSPISIDARGSDMSRGELMQHMKTALDARDAEMHRKILDLKQRGAI